MNPLNKDSLMTPALYLLIATVIHIPLQGLYEHGKAVSYALFGSVWIVAFLWNNLYLWRDDDEAKGGK